MPEQRAGARASRQPWRDVAVLLPCYNEEAAVGQVVAGFLSALPGCTVYVFDNDSTDATAARAAAAGARVRREPRRGKGHVVRRMFADIEARIYVMADGDGTYDPRCAPALIERLIADDLDMVVGTRSAEAGAYRTGHAFGNRFFNALVAMLFGSTFTDIFSGYRAFSRRFVKSFPALSRGFEIETELTVHALELRMPVAEVEIPYRSRARGSASKLRTTRDGLRILAAALLLFKEARPLLFFGTVAALLAGTALAMAYPLLTTYMATGLVPRFPTAILVTGMMVLAFVSLTCGLILDSGARGRREMKRLRYLELPSPGNG